MRRLVSPAVLLLALAGCGSAPGGSDGSREAASPRAQFTGTCGTCHTLADARTTGTFGPNLDDLKPDRVRVLAALKGGPGAMPRGLLEGAQAGAVAAYVASVAGR